MYFTTFFSKSERYKTLGKLTIVPGICNIDEPIVFGFPVVLNTTVSIRLVITPVITFLIFYTVMSLGLIPLTNGVAPALGTLVILVGLVCVGWQGVVLLVVLIAIQVLIYVPFFKIADTQAYIEKI